MTTDVIEELELHEVELTFFHPLVTAAGTHRSRRSILVSLTVSGTRGWGEAPAFPSGRFGTASEAWNDLARPKQWTDGLPNVPIARAGLEAARLDAAARAADRPLHEWIGGTERPVLARHPIGLTARESVDDLASQLSSLHIAAVKLKIAPGRDTGPIELLRQVMPDLDIGVDANGTYESASDPVFEQLAELGVTFVEQPFRADDLATHSELRNRGVIPVALDESLDLADRATEAIETRSADMLSIKLNRHGWGTFERLRTAALDHQLEIRVGGTFDTSIGRRHLLAAATLPGVVDAAVGPPAAYLATDPSDYPEMEAGFVLPSHDAGIGCDPDPMTMEQITIQRLTVEM